MLPPTLLKLARAGIKPCVDIYEIFSYWPMHALSLGISRMMEECTIRMLGDLTRTSSELVTKSAVPRHFMP